MMIQSAMVSGLRSLADVIEGLAKKKALLGAIAVGAAFGGTTASAAFLDDFSSDTSANYFFEDSYRSGGSFDVSGGTLNITTGANNTATVTTIDPVPFAVGQRLAVDVPAQAGANGLFLTLGTAAGQPGGDDIGYRWRRDAGGGGLRPASDDDGIFADIADPDKSSAATLWIDRVAADTFDFYFQLPGEPRLFVGTDVYAALATETDLHIGMQAFDSSAQTYSFDNLRVVPEPSSLAIISGLGVVIAGRRRRS